MNRFTVRVKDGEVSPVKRKEIYTEWAEEYDEDMASHLYNGPNIVAAEMAELYPPEARDVAIIDVAAGSGLAGECLYSEGFTTIDALDGCEAMLLKAKEKQVYQNLFCELLGPNRLHFDDNAYDALTGVGMFSGAHVKEDCFLELIRIIKPGGHIVFAMGKKYLDLDYLSGLEPMMQRHEAAGLWKMTVRKTVPDYERHEPGLLFVFEVL